MKLRMARCFNAFRLLGCLIMLCVYDCHHVCECEGELVRIFYVYLRPFFSVHFSVVHCVRIVSVAVTFLTPHCPPETRPLHTSLSLPPLLSASSLASFPLLSFPLLSSYVDEIRWFLLGEASVHPSAAPSRACPTPSIQVINKPANSHSPSITCCLFSTSAVLYVRPCPYAALCELTASQHTVRPTVIYLFREGELSH